MLHRKDEAVVIVVMNEKISVLSTPTTKSFGTFSELHYAEGWRWKRSLKREKDSIRVANVLKSTN